MKRQFFFSCGLISALFVCAKWQLGSFAPASERIAYCKVEGKTVGETPCVEIATACGDGAYESNLSMPGAYESNLRMPGTYES